LIIKRDSHTGFIERDAMLIKKAVIVIPPLEDFYFTSHRFSNIGAGIVSQILKTLSIESCTISFPTLSNSTSTITLPNNLDYLEKYVLPNESGPTSFFTNYKRFGFSTEICMNEIMKSEPDICLFSCFAFCYADPAIKIANRLKKEYPNVTTIFGGAAISVCPEYFLNERGVDFAVTGEAEISLQPLIESLRNSDPVFLSIPNLYWRHNDEIQSSRIVKFTDSKDIISQISLPFENKKNLFLSTTISRGCTYKCSFCSNRLSQGTTFRMIDSDKFITFFSSLDSVYSSAKNILLNIEDDNILLDYEHLKNILLYCKSKIPNISFSFENGIDYRLLSDKQCNELIDLGVKQFNFSLGTASQQQSLVENRDLNLTKLEDLYRIAKSQNIPVITYFICGFKEDTLNSIVNNLLYLSNKPTLVGISLFYAVPKLYNLNTISIKESNLKPVFFAGTSAYPWNRSLSTQTLITAFRLARFVNLLKKVNKNDQEKELMKKCLAESKIFTFIKNKNGKDLCPVPNLDNSLTRLFFESFKSQI
jgi:hypothetical protein